MRFELKLAWKYFRARRKSLARFTAVAAVVGIAAGVASLIIAQALARGFSDEMQDKILASTAHVSVFLGDGAKIENWREIKENLEKIENVREVSATTYRSSMLLGAETINYAVLRVDSQISNFKSQTGDQKTKDQIVEISIGEKLAEKTNLKIGDEAEIVVLENQIAPRRVNALVADIFRTGLYEYDSTWILVSPENFAALDGAKNFTPTVLNVSVADIYKARETAGKIREVAGENFKVLDWQEANQPLFAALSLERKVSLAIISLIIFVAVLNITTTLALLVNERRLDIAVLRTCGARARNLISVFLLEGLLLGFWGIVLGVISGLLGCSAGNYFRVINLSAEVYSLSYVPFHPKIFNILLIILIAFLLCLAASFYPAYKASRIKPLENLRTR
ncbi:MAG TPA: FtsX-like permease family protein [Pyrinomonadaceae bacterium]|jgi:lipoprotein-releasing system permease protein